MVFNEFDHYISYGSTDQQTVRDLKDLYSGLLVPGTIAAFQLDGTKGFILSLSALSGEGYVIDPRFPLFQNYLPSPKKSHEKLANLLNAPDLINRSSVPVPESFTAAKIATIAKSWIDFNNQFKDLRIEIFDKYATRLGESVDMDLSREPKYILPPYAMVGEVNDGWWNLSKNLWNESVTYAETQGDEIPLRRVIAARSPKVWGRLALEVEDLEIVAWISDLNEFHLKSELPLMDYANSLMAARERGQRVFALYGGFFAVLLSRFGLTGASHGIGYGEHRDSDELPTSGAAPARYYVPKLHRYINVELAQQYWKQFPDLISCDCEDCHKDSPSTLDYHGLMRHSVRARSREIQNWLSLPTNTVINNLKEDKSLFDHTINQFSALPPIVQRMRDAYSHLEMWIRVLESF